MEGEKPGEGYDENHPFQIFLNNYQGQNVVKEKKKSKKKVTKKKNQD